MPIRPKLAAAAASVAIASATLLAFAQPAAATDYLDCESYSSMVAYCDLFPDAGAHSERWTVNGSAWAAGDDKQNIFRIPCSPGSWVTISVSYLNDYGAAMTTSDAEVCRSGAPM
jgi:hypothetical protein